MSITTANFKFIKPELSDPADITELNANWDKIDEELANAGTVVVEAISTDGVSYTATVPFLTELSNGLEITIIPNMTSTSINPTLNVNGLGAKNIRLPLGVNTSATVAANLPTFLGKGKPVKLLFDATYLNNIGMWKTISTYRTSATDLYGITPVANGGTGADTPEVARKNLGAIAVTTAIATLTASGWSNNQQTVNVAGVTADNVVVITHAPDSYANYKDYCVRCVTQGSGTLTFKCDITPTVEIKANVAIFE